MVTIIWKYENKNNNQPLRGDMAYMLNKTTDLCGGTVGRLETKRKKLRDVRGLLEF